MLFAVIIVVFALIRERRLVLVSEDLLMVMIFMLLVIQWSFMNMLLCHREERRLLVSGKFNICLNSCCLISGLHIGRIVKLIKVKARNR